MQSNCLDFLQFNILQLRVAFPMYRGSRQPLCPLLILLWYLSPVLVPALIRKQQIGLNALMNPIDYCSGLMKQSGSEMCTLISCLQG